MRDLCLAYMERHAKPHKKSWKDDQRRIARHILPTWGAHQVASIKRPDIAKLHNQIGLNSPYETNRVIALLSKMFELSILWDFLPEEASNPAHRIQKFKEKKRDRWVTPEELPRLAQAIDKEANIPARNALWLYLLTGTRKKELLCAKWEDVDWERQELKIPDTKTGNVHYIPLSGAAVALLQSIDRLEGNDFIIPGRKASAHLVNIDGPWRRVRKAAGVEDVRLHDLRRTVGSWLAQAGNSLHL